MRSAGKAKERRRRKGFATRAEERDAGIDLRRADGLNECRKHTLLLSEEDKQSDELKALIAQLPALTTTWGGQSFAPFVRATNP